MSINLNPINFLISSGIIQIFVLAGILLVINREVSYRQRLLALVLMICGLHFTYLMLLDFNLDNRFPWLLWFPYSYMMAIGPLLYYFTLSFAEPDFRISNKEIVHFIPVLIEFGMQSFQIGWAIRFDVMYYNVISDRFVSPVIYVSASVSLFYYLRKARIIIINYEEELLQHFSEIRKKTLSWLKNLLGYFHSFWVVWIFFSVIFLVLFRAQIQNLLVLSLTYLLLLFLTYLTYWMGLQGLIKGKVMSFAGITAGVNYSSYSHISSEVIANIKKAILSAMEQQKLYLKSTLSLKDLAADLGKDPNLISFILNAHIKMTFFEFVNSYRIKEVKERLDNNDAEKKTFLAIALESGFNSKTSFNRVFNGMTGTTPSQYLKKIS